jgi:hypothetical protein
MHRPGGRCYVLQATIRLRLFSHLLSDWLMPLLDSGLSQRSWSSTVALEAGDTSLRSTFVLREATGSATASEAARSHSV